MEPQSVVPKRTAEVFSALAGVVGILVLLSWRTSLWRISALGAGYVPMAPSTALMLLLLSASIFIQLRWPGRAAARLLVLPAALGVMSYSLLGWARFPLGFELPLEQWLAPVNARLGDVPLGRMSPLTAASLLAGALAVLLWLPPLGRRGPWRQVSVALALGVVMLGLLVILSYGLDAPILYGGRTIPMALSTAMALVLLGCAVMAAADPDNWLFALFRLGAASTPATPSLRSSLGPILTILVFTLAIGATGFFYVEHQMARSRQNAQEEMAAIAKLKAAQIEAWRQERLADARVILDNAMAQQRLRRLLAGAPRDQARDDLLRWFASLVRNSGYSLVALYDSQGSPVLWAPEDLTDLSGLDVKDGQEFQAALLADDVVEIDLHLHPSTDQSLGKQVRYAIWIPIRAKAGTREPAEGVLLLQVDPNKFLYPLIKSWPTASRTAETLLVRREGGEVVFLNELRHRQGAPLTLRLPIQAHDQLPASKAVLGQKGVVEGVDYRGVPVLAALHDVPDTPWFMVAKVDQEEVYAPLRERALTIGAVTLVLILVAALGVGLFWRQRDNQWLQEQLAHEQDRQTLAERILNLNQHASDIILLLDRDWRILEANQRALAAYGHPPEELLTMSLRDLLPPDERAGFDRASLEAEGVKIHETVHQGRDGAVFPVEVSLSALEIGGQRYRQAFIRDISERKRAEAARRRDEAHLESLLRIAQTRLASERELLDLALSDAVRLTGSKMGYVYYYHEDRREFELSAWSGEAARGGALAQPQAVHPLDQAGVWAEAVRRRSAIALNDPHALDPREKAGPAGDVALNRCCVAPVLVDGRVVAVAGVADKETDYDDVDMRQLSVLMDSVWKVVERQRAAIKLRESEERYRMLFERSDDGIIVMGVEGEEAGRILDCNEAVVRGHGFSREELLAMNIADLDTEISQDQLSERLRRLMAGEWLKFEATHRKKDGSPLPVEVGVGALEFGGRRAIVSFERDISDRKRAEEEKLRLEKQLRQSQKMEAVGTLAGGIAHDFNNLLTMIVGFSELAQDSVDERAPAGEYLRQVVEAGERARKLVKQIMTFSRRTEMEMVELDLNDVVERAAKLLERTLPRMISIDRHLASDPPLVKGDPNELEQVLLNLATNAQDAMPEGGRLIFESHKVTIDEDYSAFHLRVIPGEYYLLQVSDTGEGMDENTREQIFDPFFTTKEPGKGTGLGLATVYGIVKSHGGHIFCYSEPGQGTTFKIYLPVLSEAAPLPAGSAQAGEQPKGGRESILLVDDEPALLDLGEAILTSAGYRVTTAGSGEEALELYRRHGSSLDLVIMDLSMPGMGGNKCLASILEMDPKARVIIASGYTASGTPKDSLRAGAVDFVAKPYGKKTLLASVRAALDKPRP